MRDEEIGLKDGMAEWEGSRGKGIRKTCQSTRENLTGLKDGVVEREGSREWGCRARSGKLRRKQDITMGGNGRRGKGLEARVGGQRVKKGEMGERKREK